MSQIIRSKLTLDVVPDLKSRKGRPTILFSQVKPLSSKPCSVTRKTLGFRASHNGVGPNERLDFNLAIV